MVRSALNLYRGASRAVNQIDYLIRAAYRHRLSQNKLNYLYHIESRRMDELNRQVSRLLRHYGIVVPRPTRPGEMNQRHQVAQAIMRMNNFSRLTPAQRQNIVNHVTGLRRTKKTPVGTRMASTRKPSRRD